MRELLSKRAPMMWRALNSMQTRLSQPINYG